MHNTKTKSMLLPKHHQVRHDWVLVPIVTLEAIFSCAAVPGENPHPRRVEKLNWTAEVWNVSSGVTGCLGALDDITAQAEIEKLKEKTRQCEGDPRNQLKITVHNQHCTTEANWTRQSVKTDCSTLPSSPGPLQVHALAQASPSPSRLTLVPIGTMEAVVSCAAGPGRSPHPRRVEKLNWTAEVWNVSSGVTSLGALEDITARSETEKLKEKTRQCEGAHQIN